MNDRTKNGPTPKQNKYKNPGYFWRVFFDLRRGGKSQQEAFKIVRERRDRKGR